MLPDLPKIMTQAIKDEFSQLIVFLKNPISDLERPKSKLFTFFFVFCLDVIVGFFFILIMLAMETVFDWDKYLIERYPDTNESTAVIFITGCILAPLVEEYIFRLPLKYAPDKFQKRFLFPYSFLLLILFVSVAQKSWYIQTLFWVLLWLLPVLLVYLSKNKIANRSEALFTTHFPRLFWILSSAFALVHLFNYYLNFYVILFAPILIGSQFIGGCLFGYIRLKNGFWWGVLSHAAFNGLMILGEKFS